MDLQESYEEVAERQVNLIRQQQLTIESLQQRLTEAREKSSSAVKLIQSKLDSATEHYQNVAESENLEEIRLLHLQIEDVLKEKDLLQVENSYLMGEIQKLRKPHQSPSPKRSEGGNVEVQISSGDFSEVIQILEEECERLRKTLLTCEEENIKLLSENQSLKKQIVDPGSEACVKEELNELKKAYQETQNVCLDLQHNLRRRDSELQDAAQKIEDLQREKEKLHQLLMGVEKKLSEAEHKVSQSLRLAEEALVEKDASLLREKHILDDVRKLEDRIKIVLDEGGQKARSAVEKVKESYENKVKELSEEIVRLEMEVNSKALDFDRCWMEREKMSKERDTLHKKLQVFKEEKETEVARLFQRLREVEMKLSQATSDKENLINKINKLNTEFKTNFTEALDRIGELESRLHECQKEKEKMRLEITEALKERDLLRDRSTAEMEKMKKREIALFERLQLKTRDLQRAKSENEVLEHSSQSSRQKLVSQLYSTIDALKARINSLQLFHQSQNAEYEEKLSELTRTVESLKANKEALSVALQEWQTKAVLSTEEIRRYKEKVKSLETDLNETKECVASLLKASAED